MEQPKALSMEDIIEARGLEADPKKREAFKTLLEQKALEHLKGTFPKFEEIYAPQLSPEGNLVRKDGGEGNPPTLVMRDPEAYKRIEEEVRKELGMPAIQ